MQTNQLLVGEKRRRNTRQTNHFINNEKDINLFSLTIQKKYLRMHVQIYTKVQLHN